MRRTRMPGRVWRTGLIAVLAVSGWPAAGSGTEAVPRQVERSGRLSTVRVDTQSTRAVDARRARRRAVVVRAPSRAYVVTNPNARRMAEAEAANVGGPAPSGDAMLASELVVVDGSGAAAVEARSYPDPFAADVGNVRGRGSVQRAHDGIVRADHRSVAPPVPRVRHVTRQHVRRGFGGGEAVGRLRDQVRTTFVFVDTGCRRSVRYPSWTRYRSHDRWSVVHRLRGCRMEHVWWYGDGRHRRSGAGGFAIRTRGHDRPVRCD